MAPGIGSGLNPKVGHSGAGRIGRPAPTAFYGERPSNRNRGPLPRPCVEDDREG